MPRTRAVRRGKVRITIEMEPEVVDLMEEVAEANERNLSQQLRLICKQWCDWYEQQRSKK